jgi:hypothetical protein
LGEKWLDSQIREASGISTRTVERVRERLVQEGLESALNRAKPIRVKSRVIESEKEAHLLALACGDAPDERSRWTLRLLGQHMVELGHKETRQPIPAKPSTVEKYDTEYERNGVNNKPLRRSSLRKREEFWMYWISTTRPSMAVG